MVVVLVDEGDVDILVIFANSLAPADAGETRTDDHDLCGSFHARPPPSIPLAIPQAARSTDASGLRGGARRAPVRKAFGGQVIGSIAMPSPAARARAPACRPCRP